MLVFILEGDKHVSIFSCEQDSRKSNGSGIIELYKIVKCSWHVQSTFKCSWIIELGKLLRLFCWWEKMWDIMGQLVIRDNSELFRKHYWGKAFGGVGGGAIRFCHSSEGGANLLMRASRICQILIKNTTKKLK